MESLHTVPVWTQVPQRVFFPCLDEHVFADNRDDHGRVEHIEQAKQREHSRQPAILSCWLGDVLVPSGQEFEDEVGEGQEANLGEVEVSCLLIVVVPEGAVLLAVKRKLELQHAVFPFGQEELLAETDEIRPRQLVRVQRDGGSHGFHIGGTEVCLHCSVMICRDPLYFLH